MAEFQNEAEQPKAGSKGIPTELLSKIKSAPSEFSHLHGKIRRKILEQICEDATSGRIDKRLPEAFHLLWTGRNRQEDSKKLFWETIGSIELAGGIHLKPENIDDITTPDLPNFVKEENRQTLSLALLGVGQILLDQHRLDDAVSALNRSDILGRENLETLCALGDAFAIPRTGKSRIGGMTRIIGAQRAYGRAIHLLGIDIGNADLLVPDDRLQGSQGNSETIAVYGPWAYNGLGLIRLWQSDYHETRRDFNTAKKFKDQVVSCFEKSLSLMELPVNVISEEFDLEGVGNRLREEGQIKGAGRAYLTLANALIRRPDPDYSRAYASAVVAEALDPSTSGNVGRLKSQIRKIKPDIEQTFKTLGAVPMPPPTLEVEKIPVGEYKPKTWKELRAEMEAVPLPKILDDSGLMEAGLNTTLITSFLRTTALEHPEIRETITKDVIGLVKDFIVLYENEATVRGSFLDSTRDELIELRGIGLNVENLTRYARIDAIIMGLENIGIIFVQEQEKERLAELKKLSREVERTMPKNLESDYLSVYDTYTRIFKKINELYIK